MSIRNQKPLGQFIQIIRLNHADISREKGHALMVLVVHIIITMVKKENLLMNFQPLYQKEQFYLRCQGICTKLGKEEKT
jgi:hypothetical protein